MMAIRLQISLVFSCSGLAKSFTRIILENEQGGAIDNMGGTSGGDA